MPPIISINQLLPYEGVEESKMSPQLSELVELIGVVDPCAILSSTQEDSQQQINGSECRRWDLEEEGDFFQLLFQWRNLSLYNNSSQESGKGMVDAAEENSAVSEPSSSNDVPVNYVPSAPEAAHSEPVTLSSSSVSLPLSIRLENIELTESSSDEEEERSLKRTCSERASFASEEMTPQQTRGSRLKRSISERESGLRLSVYNLNKKKAKH